MLLTMAPITALADGSSANVNMVVTPSAGTMDTLRIGDTVQIVVSNSAMTVSTFTFNVKFDKEKFECTSIVGADSEYPDDIGLEKESGKTTWVSAHTKSTLSEANNTATVGFGWAATADTKYKAATIVTITFKAKAPGSAEFVLSENSGGTDGYKNTVSTASATILKAAISSVSFTLTDPAQGAALPSLSGLGSGYTGAVEWYEGNSATGTAVTGDAKPNQVYTAKITLTADSGESFADSVTIPTGYTKDSSSTSSQLVLTKTFDATGNLTPATVTAPTAKTGLEYNGTKQVLLASVATANGGTVQYSLDNSSWSTDIPTGTDAKTYTVYYMVKGDSTHSDSAVASISATIGPKDISSAMIGTIASQPYTGSAITPDPEVKDGTATLEKGKDYTVSYDKNTNAGTATLTITGTGNYKGTNSKNFTIDPATQTLNVPGSYNVAFNKTFDLNTICSSNAPGATLKFALAPGASMPTGTTFDTATGKVKAGSNTGSFKVTVDSAAVPNYKAALQGTITVYIVTTPAASVTAAPTAKTGLKYNGNDQALVSKGTANGGTMQYSLDNTIWSTAIPKGKDAKTYTVYYMVKGDSDHTDYTPASNTVSVSIAQKEVTVAPGTYKVSKKYDTTTTAGTGSGALSVTGIEDSGVSVKATPVAYTSADVGGQSNVDVNLALSGTGSANYKLAASKISVPCSITPATLTVTPDANQSKKFNEADPTALTYTYSGNASGQTPAFNGKLDREAGENVGTYAIKLGNLALTDNGTFKASNYTLKLSSPTVNFEIKKADAPVPTGLKGVQNNELATVLLPSGWAWEASNTEMNGLGSHSFKAKYTDTTGNYNNATNVDVTVEVLAKTNVSSSITFPNGKLVYTGSGQTYEASISGIIAGDTPNWTYTYAVDLSTATATLDSSGLPLTVGKYTVTATYEDSANYGTATATLEITQATSTVTPKFDKITEKGKTLEDTHLTIASSSPVGGRIEWVDDSNNVLLDTTKVEANKAYKWKYTPADTTNYAPVYGAIVVYPVSTGIVIYSPCYTIKASAGTNGTISPAGWCSVVENGSQTFTFTPDKGYTVAKVLVDGKSVGAVKSYTFKDVTKDHTIEVIFMKSNGNPATGVFVMP